MRDALVCVPIYIPLAVTFAVGAQVAGIPTWQIVLWSALLYAGSAQLACLGALGAGAGVVECAVITFMANVRHSFVALYLGQVFREARHGILPVLGFTVSTLSLGLVPRRMKVGGDVALYTAAVQVSQWVQWIVFTAIGVVVGPLAPASWAPVLGFAVPAGFVGLLTPLMRENLRTSLVAAGVSVALALGLTVVLPPQVCAIVGAFVGALATLFVPERRHEARS